MSNKEVDCELEVRSSVVAEFLDSVVTGRVKIISSALVFEPRLQSTSLNDETIVFIPESQKIDWNEGPRMANVWNVMVDTVINLRKLSGPSLYKLSDLKV